MNDAIADRRKEGEGLIFSIQRYSIHDGPGIRTTVFFKGCPLRCRWCSNPESINPYPELIFRVARCDGCGRCISVCAPAALSPGQGCVQLDRGKCDLCLQCLDTCFAEALEVTGRYYGLEEVLDECLKDAPFYGNSGGGVTLSGGEPLNQPSFAINLLKLCKENGLHTTLDTCGYIKWEVLEQALPYTDLVLYDIKHMDPETHKNWMGVSNELILENLQRISLMQKNRIWIRIPVIPGVNDSPGNIEKTARMAAGLSVEKLSLLGYHEWGKPKYDAVGREYGLASIVPPSKERMEELAGIVAGTGIEVTIDY
ncbi:MAG: glycyl-radical enzyme activating protein [Dehalococcoidia bacterium]|nr:glycyl-radical enzyme activating protein [Dehalococcoidia bacterium]